MPKLNDTQTILLSSASQRRDGSVLPLPDKFANPGPRVASAIAALLAGALIEERETSETAVTHRRDGDLGYGLYVTPAGLAAIGVSDEAPDGTVPTSAAAPDTAPPPPPHVTKSSLVLSLLRRNEGASLAELVTATGWLPHTTRAALTGLRKKGHGIERVKRDGETRYQVIAA